MSGLVFWRAAACAALLALAAPALAQSAAPAPAGAASPARHLGVQSCDGNNCHGAVEPLPKSRVPQNEYLIWSQKDKHAKAYAVLTDERSKRIAANMGLAQPPEKSPICLECHADYVPEDLRGPQYQISDGVGCEACHGGAGNWLGPHLTGESHQANIAAGLYPTDQPEARATRCMMCHVGDDKRFATHEIMGAGHPPTPFELDTYTAIQPAHFVVNQSYIERKGKPNDIKIWAVGQAVDVKLRMDLILDPSRAPKGLNIELSLLDCESCHHPVPISADPQALSKLQWRAHSASALPPGHLKFFDATAVMLLVNAAKFAPDKAGALRDHMAALQAALGKDWDTVKKEASAVRDAANALIPVLAGHDYTKDDAKALAGAVIKTATDGNEIGYSTAQQQVMALESIVAAMKLMGYADDSQIAALNDGLKGLYVTVADDAKYDPGHYVEALKAFGAKLP